MTQVTQRRAEPAAVAPAASAAAMSVPAPQAKPAEQAAGRVEQPAPDTTAGTDPLGPRTAAAMPRGDQPPAAAPRAETRAASAATDTTEGDRGMTAPKATGAHRAVPPQMAETTPPTDLTPSSPAKTGGSDPGQDGTLGGMPLAAAADAPPPAAPGPAGRDIGHLSAHHVLRQLHEAVARKPDGPVEVALAPEELGRVRMTLHPAEHGITVAVQAERAETLDLMRRNIELLARDFRELGYADVSFSFGAESGQHQGGDTAPDSFAAARPEGSATPAVAVGAPAPPSASAPRSADGSLDLRM